MHAWARRCTHGRFTFCWPPLLPLVIGKHRSPLGRRVHFHRRGPWSQPIILAGPVSPTVPGGPRTPIALSGTEFGFDFNPAADALPHRQRHRPEPAGHPDPPHARRRRPAHRRHVHRRHPQRRRHACGRRHRGRVHEQRQRPGHRGPPSTTSTPAVTCSSSRTRPNSGTLVKRRLAALPGRQDRRLRHRVLRRSGHRLRRTHPRRLRVHAPGPGRPRHRRRPGDVGRGLPSHAAGPRRLTADRQEPAGRGVLPAAGRVNRTTWPDPAYLPRSSIRTATVTPAEMTTSANAGIHSEPRAACTWAGTPGGPPASKRRRSPTTPRRHR